ncbi:hypothetical protein VTI28DRAFT_9162 [Corynascus sepedonium]
MDSGIHTRITTLDQGGTLTSFNPLDNGIAGTPEPDILGTKGQSCVTLKMDGGRIELQVYGDVLATINALDHFPHSHHHWLIHYLAAMEEQGDVLLERTI